MEIEEGKAYLTKLGLFKAVRRSRGRDDEWVGPLLYDDGSMTLQGYMPTPLNDNSEFELDPKVWDKAMKLHDVYMASLKSLIQNVTNEQASK